MAMRIRTACAILALPISRAHAWEHAAVCMWPCMGAVNTTMPSVISFTRRPGITSGRTPMTSSSYIRKPLPGSDGTGRSSGPLATSSIRMPVGTGGGMMIQTITSNAGIRSRPSGKCWIGWRCPDDNIVSDNLRLARRTIQLNWASTVGVWRKTVPFPARRQGLWDR